MATLTRAPLSPSQKALRSTVVLKALMAVTGLIMIAYLLVHMYGNLKVFSGQAAFDGYAEHLHELGEPILPRDGALWIFRVVLLASLVGHTYAAVKLWSRNRTARGGAAGATNRYASNRNARGVQRSYASFTLRWGGLVILLFVIYHLLHLTWNVIAPGGPSGSSYERVVNGFSVWWVVASYTVALVALAFHLRHGMWAAMMTLGANVNGTVRTRLNQLAYVVAAVITVGFLIPPYSILFGLVN